MPYNVLYLTYDGLTDPLGQSQVLPYLEGLSENGYQITIISFEKPERYEQHKALIEARTHQAGISWYPKFYRKKPPVISTILDFRCMQKLAFKLYKQTPCHIVHCRSYIPALVGQHLKEKLGVKFVFDMRGFWADERVEGGLWNRKNPLFNIIYHYFKKHEQEFLNSADYTISLTQAGKEEIESWPGWGKYPPPIEVIPCCVDLELFERKEDADHEVTELRRSPDEFLLAYLGSVGTWYMLPDMLRFFKVLLQYKSAARFVFITHDDPVMIENEALALDIPEDKLTIIPATRQEVPLYLKQCDASVFFIKPVFSKKASSPTKMGEVLSMGLPAITNTDVGDNDRIIENGKNGLLVEQFDDNHFHQLLQQYELSNIGEPECCRQTACDWFSLKNGVEDYSKVYRYVLPD